ncbi:frataxin [Candidatus Photodesmus blepharus]|uniref:Iron-sulfur cluster assembly protein CyaY n=1 Tax=Candidatus Photodesmus blepharonis TaxID=1179155 RepID=A0A084CNL2_9GAMM|nr:iron donor protein CyaY [Candidatus Photodesmus blepharus]KEY91391.1 frataxin [Candidatus Photodesmus blepharus]
MNNSEFHQLADAQMRIIEETMIHSDADIDFETSGNVMILEFGDSSKIIINRQELMHELWLASKSGGFHFKLIGNKWSCSKTSIELLDMVKKECEKYIGKKINWT